MQSGVQRRGHAERAAVERGEPAADVSLVLLALAAAGRLRAGGPGTTRGLPKGAVDVQQHAGVAFNFNGATAALQCHGSDAYTIPFPS